VKRKLAVPTVLAMGLVLLAGCQEGTVKKKRGCEDGKPCEILVVDKNKKERWVEVDQNIFKQCSVGEWYTEKNPCGFSSGMRNIPVEEGNPQNDPYRRPNRDKQDQNARQVCFKWTVEPVRFLSVLIRTGTKVPFDKKQNWGEATRCYSLSPGTSVSLAVQTTGEARVQRWPDMLCKIWQTTSRGEQTISFDSVVGTNAISCSGVVK
jgi:hypothetical protein